MFGDQRAFRRTKHSGGGQARGIWSLEERRRLERRLLESSTKMDVVGGTGVGEHPAGHGTSASWGPQEQRVLQGDGK